MFGSTTIVSLAVIASTLLKQGSAAPAPKRLRLESRYANFNYNDDKVRGVNLGGWLVCEPWITPSVFEAAGDSAVDEYTLGEAGYDLTTHWQTWITETDFANIAAAGLNHVRIPIGYWGVVYDPPYNFGAIDYLDQAVTWARTYGIKVLVDLHGASLSQNGFDNSGHYGNVEWGSSDSYSATLSAVSQLAQRYKDDTDTVTLIELMNEPLPENPDTYITLDELKQYNTDGWNTVYNDASENYVTVFHDAFQGISYWNGFGDDFTQVMLDTHIYYVFSDDQLAESQSDRISSVCSYKSELEAADKWTIVGEWCSATTDCAMWLNGRNKGARYDGTYESSTVYGSCDGLYQGSVDDLSDSQKASIRQMNEAQIESYEGRTGWVFWTWKQKVLPNGIYKLKLELDCSPNPLKPHVNMALNVERNLGKPTVGNGSNWVITRKLHDFPVERARCRGGKAETSRGTKVDDYYESVILDRG